LRRYSPTLFHRATIIKLGDINFQNWFQMAEAIHEFLLRSFHAISVNMRFISGRYSLGPYNTEMTDTGTQIQMQTVFWVNVCKNGFPYANCTVVCPIMSFCPVCNVGCGQTDGSR